MLVIRLSRIGRKGEAKYRVVVKEKRSKRDGSAVELLGSYEKVSNSKVVKKINTERLEYWKKQGAQISQAVEKALAA